MITLSDYEQTKYYIDVDAAERVILFFENYLTHFEAQFAGKPFLLLPWQKEIIYRLFGVKKKSDGLRRYREAYIEIPRKSGKSTIAAGLALYMLLGDGEQGAQVYSVANSHAQARIIYNAMSKMIAQNPILKKRLRVKQYEITDATTNSVYKYLDAEANTKDGYNPSFFIYDELHEARDRSLYDKLATGMNARKQPLFITITTAGNDMTSFCYELHTKAERLLNGESGHEYFFPCIYSADPTDDYTDPRVWEKATPSWGQTVHEETLRTELERLGNTPRGIIEFKKNYLNIWSNSEESWLDPTTWRQAYIEEPTDLQDWQCWIGVDMAVRVDMSAVVAVFKHPSERRFYIKPFLFCPQNSLEKAGKTGKMDYTAWASQGYLTIAGYSELDTYVVLDTILDLKSRYNIQSVVTDPAYAEDLIRNIKEADLRVIRQPMNQLSRLSSLYREVEGLVASKLINHSSHPVMDWMIGNVCVKYDGQDNLILHKSVAKEKIDGVVAMCLGLSQAIVNNSGGSPYADGEIYF